jgi:hypothetical protein
MGGGGEERLGKQGRQAIRQAVRRRYGTPELKGLTTKTFPFSFFFHGTISSVDILLFFDWGIVLAKSLFKNCKKRLSLLFCFQ